MKSQQALNKLKIKELIIKISLFVLLVLLVIAPVLLSVYFSVWFMCGWISIPFVVAFFSDYCEDHNESYFLNNHIDF